MDGPALLVLAVLALISLVLVMGEKLASDVEQFFTTWIGVFQPLRDLVRRHPSLHEHNSEDGDR